MIDTQAIRSKILNLAMRGKLTEQLPEDGTAEELYRQIQAEKQALIKAGKIKKEKPLPEIADGEVPFEIPKNWKLCRFGTVITLVSGTDYAPEEYNDEGRGVPYITGASNLLSEGVLINRWTEKPRCMANFGDVLLVCKGSGYGKVAMCDIGEAHIARQIMAVKKTSFLEMRFLLYFLMANFNYLKDKGQGLIPGVDRKSVLNMLFLIPPLAEQHRIVARIEQAFSLLDTIDALQAKYADNLAVLKSKLIDAAIQGKLTEQLPEDGTAEDLYRQIQAEKQALIKAGKIKKEKPLPEIAADEVPFEIPKSWKWVSLGNITSKISSGNTPPGGSKSDVYVPSGFPLFREQNIYDDGIHQAGMVFISEQLLETRQNSTVKANDILLNITGGSIGRCSLVPNDFDRGSINQHILIIRTVEPETRFYIHMLIRSSYIQSHIKNKAVGDKDGFSGGRCKRMLVPLPPLTEQKRIVAKLEELLPLCERLK